MTDDSFWSQLDCSDSGYSPFNFNHPAPLLVPIYADQQSNEAQEYDIYESEQSDNEAEPHEGNAGQEEANGETGEAPPREAEAGFRVQRVTNCIFKTSLSSYRKALVKTAQSNHQLQWLRVLINQVYDMRSKNQGMFPKLNYMSRKLRIEEAVNQKWSKEVESLLNKKREKISARRYHQLTIDIHKMKECIQEENFWRCFEHYWGKFTQDTKYKNSREDLKKFTEDFDQKIKDQAAIEEMKKKLPSLKRKKVSSSKAPQKQLEPIYQETSHTE